MYGFIAFIVVVFVLAILGDKGFLTYYRLKRERDSIMAYNNELREKNKALTDEIARLKTDERYIAKVAREELGMIGENEVIYKFKK